MGGMDRHIVIREYEPADKEAVLSLIRANTPEYFAPEEEADLSRYLDCEREWFYVLLFDGKIVGCGGINLADERTTGKISWDILHPEYQGRSLGTRLLGFRIEKLGSLGGIRRITVRTSQLAFGFYRKQGFVLKEVKKDYWAEGFDLYVRRLEMTVANVRFLNVSAGRIPKAMSRPFSLREGVGRCFRSEICGCGSRNIRKHDSPVCAETSL